MRRLSFVCLLASVACLVAVASLMLSSGGDKTTSGTATSFEPSTTNTLNPLEDSKKVIADLEAIVDDSGAAAGVEKLRELTVDRFLSDNCHMIAHKLGQKAAAAEGVKQAIVLAPDLCQGGYLHGVLQAAVTDDSVDAKVCELLVERWRSACAHGFGHLLAERYPNSIDDTMALCVELEDGRLVAQCGGGAAMEYGANLVSAAGTGAAVHQSSTMGPLGPIVVHLDAAQLARPCRVLQEEEAKHPEVEGLADTCISHLALFWMTDPTISLNQLVDKCRVAAPLDLGLCARSAAWRIVERDNEEVAPGPGAEILKNTCSALKALTQPCAAGATIALATNSGGDSFPECTLLEGALRAGCEEGRVIFDADRAQSEQA